MKFLLELTADSSSDELTGMSISEEVGGVGNNLADVEVVTTINTVGNDTSLEGTNQTAGRNAALIGSNRVGKGNTRWSSAALGRLMDMCRCQGCGLVFTGNTRERDVLMRLLVCLLDESLKVEGYLRSK